MFSPNYLYVDKILIVIPESFNSTSNSTSRSYSSSLSSSTLSTTSTTNDIGHFILNGLGQTVTTLSLSSSQPAASSSKPAASSGKPSTTVKAAASSTYTSASTIITSTSYSSTPGAFSNQSTITSQVSYTNPWAGNFSGTLPPNGNGKTFSILLDFCVCSRSRSMRRIRRLLIFMLHTGLISAPHSVKF